MTRWLTIAAALGAVACGTTGSVRMALHGDLPGLKRAIHQEQRAGELDKGDVEELAQAVARRELNSARGVAAAERMHRMGPCVSALLPVLRRRADRPDDAGAEATLLLFEHGELGAEALIDRHADASSGAWRAVAARASKGRKHGSLRRKLMTDVDERARRAALRASFESADRGDLPTLLESARLDPDAQSRALAIRAAGALGGLQAVLALDDLWARAGEATRLAIVDAWSIAASYRAGGEERLVRTAESTSGLPSVTAAWALARTRGAHAELGAALLARAVREGTLAERTLAIEVAPFWDSDVRKAVQQASSDRDSDVRVAALTRLVENSRSGAAARAGLRALARGSDPVSVRARSALAAAGDDSIRGRLLEQMAARNPEDRRSAALALLRLDAYPQAATALADDDPWVRTDVACSILSAD